MAAAAAHPPRGIFTVYFYLFFFIFFFFLSCLRARREGRKEVDNRREKGERARITCRHHGEGLTENQVEENHVWHRL
jgi:hypothetical protein